LRGRRLERKGTSVEAMNGVGNGGVTTGMAANSSMSGGAGGASGGFATLGREDRKSKRAELKLELERVNKEIQRVEVKIAKKRRSLGLQVSGRPVH